MTAARPNTASVTSAGAALVTSRLLTSAYTAYDSPASRHRPSPPPTRVRAAVPPPRPSTRHRPPPARCRPTSAAAAAGPPSACSRPAQIGPAAQRHRGAHGHAGGTHAGEEGQVVGRHADAGQQHGPAPGQPPAGVRCAWPAPRRQRTVPTPAGARRPPSRPERGRSKALRGAGGAPAQGGGQHHQHAAQRVASDLVHGL
jgi:hypothetical protein